MKLLNELLALAGSTQPLKTREEIATWLDKMKVKGYEIDEDLFVDGDVDLSNKNLTSNPVKFGAVGGNFKCSDNSLTSLTGAPLEVGGGFWCYNNKFKDEPNHSFINVEGQFKWRN